MSTALQDTIEQEVLIRAPRDKVFDAFADPVQIATWFVGGGVKGSLAVGEISVFDFGKHGKYGIYVEKADRPSYFAYRWSPTPRGNEEDPRDQPNTLVEVFLDEVPEGTRLRLKESGFASLPAEFYEKALCDNTQGWEEELASLVKYAEAL